jgi:hypothetical protein
MSWGNINLPSKLPDDLAKQLAEAGNNAPLEQRRVAEIDKIIIDVYAYIQKMPRGRREVPLAERQRHVAEIKKRMDKALALADLICNELPQSKACEKRNEIQKEQINLHSAYRLYLSEPAFYEDRSLTWWGAVAGGTVLGGVMLWKKRKKKRRR